MAIDQFLVVCYPVKKKKCVQLSTGQIVSNVVKLVKFVFGPSHLPRAHSSPLLVLLSPLNSSFCSISLRALYSPVPPTVLTF
jgi:hypothetical protein